MMSHVLPDMKSVEIATIDRPAIRKQARFSIFECLRSILLLFLLKNNE